ncbi:hypothetical protein BDF14DRAFT_1812663, partial [Spinellus fusiger]
MHPLHLCRPVLLATSLSYTESTAHKRKSMLSTSSLSIISPHTVLADNVTCVFHKITAAILRMYGCVFSSPHPGDSKANKQPHRSLSVQSGYAEAPKMSAPLEKYLFCLGFVCPILWVVGATIKKATDNVEKIRWRRRCRITVAAIFTVFSVLGALLLIRFTNLGAARISAMDSSLGVIN